MKFVILTVLLSFLGLSDHSRADYLTFAGMGFSAAERDHLTEVNNQKMNQFIASLAETERSRLVFNLETSFASEFNPVFIPNRSGKARLRKGTVYLFLHGSNPEQQVNWWAETFYRVFNEDQTAYLFKWAHRHTLDDAATELVQTLKWIAKNHSRQKIEVVALSAGGAIALKALDLLSNSLKNIHVSTVASPLGGTGGANPTARRMSTGIFAGPMIGSIAAGAVHEFSRSRFEQCDHFITTECAFDIHACRGASGLPQQPSSGMPCGRENTFELPKGTTHYEAINEVVKILFDRNRGQY